MANWEDVKLRSFKEVLRVYMQLMDMRYYVLAYRNKESTIADRGQEEWDKTEQTLNRVEEKHGQDYLQLLVKSPQALEELTLRLETMINPVYVEPGIAGSHVHGHDMVPFVSVWDLLGAHIHAPRLRERYTVTAHSRIESDTTELVANHSSPVGKLISTAGGGHRIQLEPASH